MIGLERIEQIFEFANVEKPVEIVVIGKRRYKEMIGAKEYYVVELKDEEEEMLFWMFREPQKIPSIKVEVEKMVDGGVSIDGAVREVRAKYKNEIIAQYVHICSVKTKMSEMIVEANEEERKWSKTARMWDKICRILMVY